MTDTLTISGGTQGHVVTVTVTGSHALSLAEQYAGVITGGSAGSDIIQVGGVSTIYGGVDATYSMTGSASVVAGVSDTITASADVTLIGGSGFSETGSVSLKFIGTLGSSTVASGGSSAVMLGNSSTTILAGAGNDTLLGAHTATAFPSTEQVISTVANIAGGYSSGSITISDFNKVATNLATLYGHTQTTAVPTSVSGGSHTVALSDKASITFSDVSHLKH